MSEQADQLSSTKQVLLALRQARERLEASERSRTEPIAIVGMGCRFPGGANDPITFWQLLHDGVDAIREIPAERWDVAAHYDPDPDVPGKMYTRYGGFVGGVDQFDPEFFGISPREASSMDPQQRLLLEVCWEALENAGHAPERLRRSQTGVFIGSSTDDYAQLSIGLDTADAIDAYTSLGTYRSVAAGRLAYLLGLQGPAVQLDTACSSSLVAVHLGCQSLRAGECELALVGGVNLILSPLSVVGRCALKALSADGRCRTFDAAADGFGLGEGCGVLVLKRQSDAVADGDNILALIRGSAVNHDGPSSGLTVPNELAQEELLRQALRNARAEPHDVHYVDAHGTATALGDPIEVGALGTVFCKERREDDPLVIGSVKTNIGHLEAAAGVAGIMKVALAFLHEEIPQHLHFTQPNPHIPWAELPITVPTERTPWPRGQAARLAGVSSFGLSGTNAHVVLQEPPVQELAGDDAERPLHVLALSAKTKQALHELTERYVTHLDVNPGLDVGDVCHTANAGRSHFQHRLAVVAERSAELRDKLSAVSAGDCVAAAGRPKVGFLFTGQGSQYPGMGRQLYQTQPTFRRMLDRCDEILHDSLQPRLLEVLYGEGKDSALLNETTYTQPALFALEVSLAELWRSWGIEPVVAMGHSAGEYAAACVAGVFSLEDGLKLIAERARLTQELAHKGEMVAAFADEARVSAIIEPYRSEVAIAAVNGPANVVMSGHSRAMEPAAAALRSAGVKTRKLAVSHAFHSALMEPMLGSFESALRRVTYSAPRLPLVSNVTGALASGQVLGPEYWLKHTLEPVRFADGMAALSRQGCEVFVEIGPKPTLLGLARQCLPEEVVRWLPSLRPGRSDWQSMLGSLAELYAHGVPVDWRGFDKDYSRRRVMLPTYPWQRERCWVERAQTVTGHRGKLIHPLLGRRLYSAIEHRAMEFESHLNCNSPAFLRDHRIFQTALLPATACIEIALAAGGVLFSSDGLVLEGISLVHPLVLPNDQVKTLRTVLEPNGSQASVRIFSAADDGEDGEPSWVLHASGALGTPANQRDADQARRSIGADRNGGEVELQGWYDKLRERGLEYGPSFQIIEQLWRSEGEALGRIQLPEALAADASAYWLHPAVLDAGFQIAAVACPVEGSQHTFLPVAIDRVCVRRAAACSVWCHAKTQLTADPDEQTLTAELTLFDDEGVEVARVEGLHARGATRDSLLGEREGDWLFEMVWQPKPGMAKHTAPADESRGWLVFADQDGLGVELAEHVRGCGEQCVMVSAGQAYHSPRPGRLTIDPAEPEHYQRLLRECFAEGGPSRIEVVHMWSLDGSAERGNALSDQTLGCGSVLHLVQALGREEARGPRRLSLVTRGAQPVERFVVPPSGGPLAVENGPPEGGTTQWETGLQVYQAPLWGLARVVALEHPDLHCTRIDLDPAQGSDEGRILSEELRATNGEDQIAFRRGERFVPRLVRYGSAGRLGKGALEIPREGSYRLKIAEYGILENLAIEPAPRREPGPGEVEIQILATGLNFRDVLNAMGMIKGQGNDSAGDLAFGGECAGRVARVGEGVDRLAAGDEVIAALAIGSMGNFVTVDARFVITKPAEWTSEEAATVPIAFLTARYALCELARVGPGDRVLIHAAAGGVGQAAVQLARQAGAEILATASPAKWEFLKQMGIEHVMSSRSLDFAEGVMAATHGQGADIVLNSLSGDFIPKSFEVLKPGGRFVEIGKLGVWSEDRVRRTRPDVSYWTFDLGQVAERDPELVGSMLNELAQEFEQGRLQPLPLTTFSIAEAPHAFRYMAQARHIGKVVLSQSRGSGTGARSPATIRGDASYLITGGFGGLGREVAQWLVEHGAKNLVMAGRSGARSGAAQELVERLEQAGARVLALQADVSDETDAARMLDTASAGLPPTRGIIHAAGVLDDGVLLRQSWERLAKVMAPKVAGAWNLHRLTEGMSLDFFVCFSSAASLLGSPGQGSYAAANAFLDALAHHRRALGRPCLTVNWGPWAEVGMAEEMASPERKRLAVRGLGAIAPEKALAILGELLAQDATQVAVLSVDWRKFLEQFSSGKALPLLECVAVAPKREGARALELPRRLAAATAHERRPLLIAHVRAEVSKVLGLAATQQIAPRRRLFDLGVDSLMAVELKNRLERSLGRPLRSTLLFDYPTVEALVDYLAQDLLPAESDTLSGSAEREPEPSADLADLSEDELADRLARRLADIKGHRSC